MTEGTTRVEIRTHTGRTHGNTWYMVLGWSVGKIQIRARDGDTEGREAFTRHERHVIVNAD